VEHGSIQQIFIDAAPETIWELVGDPNRHPDWWPGIVEVECADLREGCRYREVVKGFLRPQEHDILIERLDTCQEVCISCQDTGVTTRFVLTGAQGGTFVEGHFSIEPQSVGTKVVTAVTGRRFIRSWLERSLENLKHAAERAPAPL
jgi:Polyketide cyclase / dehydrase and lipid transport